MTKWCLITDQHFGARNDSKIFHNLYRQYYSEVFMPLIKNEGVTHVVVCGDFFDRRKYINFETLKLAKEIFFEPLKELGLEVHVILGNHDVMYRNTNKVNSLSLLITEESYPNVRIYENPTTVDIGAIKTLMLPWVNSENYQESRQAIETTEAQVIVSHLEMQGFEYFKGMFSERGHFETELFDRFEFVFSGHYHHKSSRGNIHFLGTPYEITWADYNDPKGVHLFDGKELIFKENPYKTFVKLEYNNGIMTDVSSLNLKDKYVKVVVTGKDNPKDFERTLDKLLEQGPIDLRVIDETNSVREILQEGEETKAKSTLDVIKDFVYNDLETDLNKEKLLKKLFNLYIEASKIGEDE